MDRPEVTGHIKEVNGDVLTLVTSRGDERIERSAVKEIVVIDRTKQIAYGVLSALAGGVLGFFACPSCINEGNSARARANIMIGAALGSMIFLIERWTPIYKASKSRP